MLTTNPQIRIAKQTRKLKIILSLRID